MNRSIISGRPRMLYNREGGMDKFFRRLSPRSRRGAVTATLGSLLSGSGGHSDAYCTPNRRPLASGSLGVSPEGSLNGPRPRDASLQLELHAQRKLDYPRIV